MFLLPRKFVSVRLSDVCAASRGRQMPNTRVNRGNINHKPKKRNKSAWNFSIYSCVRACTYLERNNKHDLHTYSVRGRTTSVKCNLSPQSRYYKQKALHVLIGFAFEAKKHPLLCLGNLKCYRLSLRETLLYFPCTSRSYIIPSS